MPKAVSALTHTPKSNSSSDIKYNEYLSRFLIIKESIKKHEELLKNFPIEGVRITDEITGETYKVFPPAKKSTTVVSVSLK